MTNASKYKGIETYCNRSYCFEGAAMYNAH